MAGVLRANYSIYSFQWMNTGHPHHFHLPHEIRRISFGHTGKKTIFLKSGIIDIANKHFSLVAILSHKVYHLKYMCNAICRSVYTKIVTFFLRKWRIPNRWWMQNRSLRHIFKRRFLLLRAVLCALDFKLCKLCFKNELLKVFPNFQFLCQKTQNLTLISNLFKKLHSKLLENS